jgi:hypothetical protein
MYVRTHTRTQHIYTKKRGNTSSTRLCRATTKTNLECPAKRDEFRIGPKQLAADPQVPAVKGNKGKEEPNSARK